MQVCQVSSVNTKPVKRTKKAWTVSLTVDTARSDNDVGVTGRESVNTRRRLHAASTHSYQEAENRERGRCASTHEGQLVRKNTVSNKKINADVMGTLSRDTVE